MTSHPGDNPNLITSASNPALKRVRSLQRRRSRLQERAFIVEGVRAVNDALQANQPLEAIYIRDDFDLEALDRRGSVPIPRRVAGQVFDDLSDVVHPQGVLAIMPMTDPAELPGDEPGSSPLVVILDGIRDPGNMGTLFRSAAGAGVDHLVVGPGCVDPYAPKVVRSAMGAHWRIPFSQRSWEELDPLLEQLSFVALADARGDAVYDMAGWEQPCAMVIGGEAFGPSDAAHARATLSVTIPLLNGMESLNAGVAGSLLMFEASRQRRAGANS